MKPITKYVADDGCEFTSKAECEKHDALIAEVDQIMSVLPKLPKDDGCDFANGHGYIQHDREKLMAVVRKLVDLMTPHVKSLNLKWWGDAADPVKCHPSWVGRFAGECCPAPLWKAWNRICCVNFATFREYGQPYFAGHEHEARGGRINK